jgi:hypothetical protein
MHITKNFESAAQSSGRVKIFCPEQWQIRAAVKRIRGTLLSWSSKGLWWDTFTFSFYFPNQHECLSHTFLPRQIDGSQSVPTTRPLSPIHHRICYISRFALATLLLPLFNSINVWKVFFSLHANVAALR